MSYLSYMHYDTCATNWSCHNKLLWMLNKDLSPPYSILFLPSYFCNIIIRTSILFCWLNKIAIVVVSIQPYGCIVVSILMYGYTTYTLTKSIKKKLASNYTRMLCAVLNKSGKQHFKKHQLYSHLTPISKPIQVRQTRQSWKRKDELIRDTLLWTPTHGWASVGWPAITYICYMWTFDVVWKTC